MPLSNGLLKVSFADSQEGKDKPYQDQIDTNNTKIEAYQNDKIKGEMRWGNQDKIERIERQNDSLLSLQLTELAEARTLHSGKNKLIEIRRDRAGKGLKKLSGFLYVIMLVVAIPLGYFITLIDLKDGVLDGRVDQKSTSNSSYNWWRFRRKNRSVGYQTTANSGSEEEKLRMEIENLKRELAKSSQSSDFAEKKQNTNSKNETHNFIYSETKMERFQAPK